MHQGDARPMTPEFQRGDGRGVLGPHHNHVRVEVGMRLAIVMRHLRQLFPGHIQAIGQIVVAGCHHQFSCPKDDGAGEQIRAVYEERATGMLCAADCAVLAYIEAVELGHLAVVLERLQARGLLLGAYEGNVADLQQLRRGKERHVCRVVIQRIAQAPLLYGQGGVARAPYLNGAGEAGGTGADDEHVVLLHAFLNFDGTRMCPPLTLDETAYKAGRGMRAGSHTPAS